VKLEHWRGANVLLTDGAKHPVLVLGPHGNVVEWSGATEAANDDHPAPSDDSLARSVAGWITWTADEPGEFRAVDVHPRIRDLVRALAPDLVFP
jgi:hypothetical protein